MKSHPVATALFHADKRMAGEETGIIMLIFRFPNFLFDFNET
jgi:hypothetical protein